MLFYNDHIEAREGGKLSVWDGESPGFENCRDSSLVDQALPTEKLRIGIKVCFRTDQGRYGSFTVEDLFLDSYGNLVMGFSYTLWDEDGVEFPPFRALRTITGITYPRGSSGIDLDFYRNHQVADLSFQYGSLTTMEIHPSEVAEIAYWGTEMPTYEDCAGLALNTEREILETEIIPIVSPVKDTPIFCFRTNEGRLGRLYPRWVYFDASSAPLPYGDTMASRDFYNASTMTEEEVEPDYLVEYTADTWVLDEEKGASFAPERKAEGIFSGRAILPFQDSFDFDTGSTLADFRSLLDVEYHSSDETQEATLFPANDDILLAIWGDDEPSYQDCRGAALSNAPVALEEGQYICFQSSTGRFGYYLVNSFYYDPKHHWIIVSPCFLMSATSFGLLMDRSMFSIQPVCRWMMAVIGCIRGSMIWIWSWGD